MDQDGSNLQEAIGSLGDAWARGDVATLETLLSASYTHIDVFGSFHDRASWLDYVGRRAGRATQISFRDVLTRIVGDVAVVTGINDISGPGGRSADDRSDLSLRFTQVWVRHDGKWLREALQATPIQALGRLT